MDYTDRMTTEQKRAYIRRKNLLVAVRKAYAKGELSDKAMRKLESEGIKLEDNRHGTLLEERPDLLEEWDWEENEKRGLRPDEVTAGSTQPACWKHWHEESKMWHRWEAVIVSRVGQGHGCSVCAGRKVLKGFNDLATTHPDLLEEWDWEENEKRGLRPDEVTAGSTQPACWKHWHEESKMWHRWETAIANRTLGGSGCLVCAGKKVLKGFNDLATKRPHIAAQWNPTKNDERTAQDVTAGAGGKFWWRCPNCGHQWKQSINNRIRQYPKKPCPECLEEPPGFDTINRTEERPDAQDKPS